MNTEKTERGWTDVTLPSRGFFYGDAVPDGKAQVRKLTMDEQAKLQSAGLDPVQRIAGIIRVACRLPRDFPADNLLITDRQALLLYQRVYTLGPSYTFTYRCPGCGKSVKHTTNILNDLEETTPAEAADALSRLDPPQELAEPFHVELPDAGVVVECRFLRGTDVSEVVKRAKQFRMASVDNSDPSAIIRLALVINAVNGERLDTRRKEQMVRGMTLGDSLRIEHATELRETGVDTTVRPSCSLCGFEAEIDMPFDATFFRPTADQRGGDPGAHVFLAVPRKGVYGGGGRGDDA